MPHTDISVDEKATIQKRTIKVLMMSVIPAGMSTAGAFPTTSLLAEEITGSDAWGGAAAACLTVGAAVAALPLSRRMAKLGRRPGLRLGFLVALAGATLAFLAAIVEVFPLLVVGALMIGSGSASTLAARYASADLAEEETRARTIGILVWAGTVGAVLGPTLATGPASWFAETVGLPKLAGPYMLAMAGFAFAAVVCDRLLRPDPLVISGGVDAAGATDSRPSISQSFAKLWTKPIARLGVLAMATGHAVMVGVMTMTPLHMKSGDHELRIIGLVISLHIVGMYVFSPAVGWLVDKVGPRPVIAAAGVILFIGAETASHTDPEDSMGVFVGLFLVGLGWSFNLIAGSSILASVFTPEERATTQGASDLIMVGSGATAGLMSGVIVDWNGYHFLAHWAGVAALILPLIAGLAIISQRNKQSPAVL